MARRSPHDRRLMERLDELERSPFCDPVRADHTDRYPDPAPINGHVPDYVTECSIGPDIIGEVEEHGVNPRHTESQIDAFQRAEAESPSLDFEVSWVEEQHESKGLLDLF